MKKMNIHFSGNNRVFLYDKKFYILKESYVLCFFIFKDFIYP